MDAAGSGQACRPAAIRSSFSFCLLQLCINSLNITDRRKSHWPSPSGFSVAFLGRSRTVPEPKLQLLISHRSTPFTSQILTVRCTDISEEILRSHTVPEPKLQLLISHRSTPFTSQILTALRSALQMDQAGFSETLTACISRNTAPVSKQLIWTPSNVAG
jgi:hypothetical protein